MTLATFCFLCTCAFVVGSRYDHAPVEGTHASVFITVPDNLPAAVVADGITRALGEESVLVRADVRSSQPDSYLFLGANSPRPESRPFRPVGQPHFTAVAATGSVDLGGHWDLFTSNAPGSIVTGLRGAGVQVVSDDGDSLKYILGALWKAMLVHCGLLLFVLYVAVYLYLGSARASAIQRLTVLGWDRREVLRELLRPVLRTSVLVNLAGCGALLVAWGIYNQWSRPDLVLSIVLGGSVLALAGEAALLIAGALLVTWLPTREESADRSGTSARTYRAAVIAQCMLLAVGIVAVGQLPQALHTMRALGAWEQTWKGADDTYRVALNSAILAQSRERQEADYAAIARMLGTLPTRVRIDISQSAPGIDVLADASVLSELGLPRNLSLPALVSVGEPPRADVVNDWLAFEVRGSQTMSLEVRSHRRLPEGTTLRTWNSQDIGEVSAFDRLVIHNPTVLILPTISADTLVSGLTRGEVFIATADPQRIWRAAEQAGLAGHLNAVVPISERPLLLIDQSRTAVVREVTYLIVTCALTLLAMLIVLSVHYARYGRRDAQLRAMGWSTWDTTRPLLGVMSAVVGLAVLAAIGAFGPTALLSSGLLALLLLAAIWGLFDRAGHRRLKSELMEK